MNTDPRNATTFMPTIEDNTPQPHPWLNAHTFESTTTRTVVEFDADAVEAVLNVDQILAIYKVGDKIQVITESA